MPATPSLRWIRRIRPHDIVWILLFAALAYSLQNHDFFAMTPLIGLAVVQVLESKISALEMRRNRILWVALKLVLGFLFVGFTGSINSPYWWVMLLPALSAATTVGVAGTMAVSMAAAGAYLLFLFFIDWTQFMMEPTDVAELVVRVVSIVMAGNLASVMAEDLRTQSAKYRRTAEQLAAANAQLQEAEEAVRRSERLAALGQLSAGLAHELRNPMGTIKASAEMLHRSVQAENEVAREVSGFIASEVDRANSLITRFLQFARPLELRWETADLGHTLDRAVAMAEREAPEISIYKNYPPDIAPFPYDAELMERVFYNLVLNAAQATPAGGAVTVKARAVGGVAEVAVIDRGAGIEAKNRASIFNPFFTTKPQGVGLGLAIVARIVDEHGGTIAVESEPGKGSVFRVLLPMDHEPLTIRSNP